MRRTLLFVPALVALLALPSTATAAGITASSVTTPVSGSRIVSDRSAGAPNDVTFSGTSTITAPTDQIDLRCYSRNAADSGWDSIDLKLGVDTDDVTGAWSTSADVSARGQACLIRAVPASTVPDLTAAPEFAGPTVYFANFQKSSVSAGPNAGVVYGWYAEAGQSGAANQVGSPNGYGLAETFLYSGANLRKSESLWYYNAGLIGAVGYPFDGASGLQVDGNYGWLPEALNGQTFNGTPAANLPGFVGIDVTISHDPTTGAINTVEGHPVLRCNAGASVLVPPASCTSLVSTGVRLLRTTTFSADGRQVRIVDTYRSADGAAHAVKAQYYEAHQSLADPSFSFPWISSGVYSVLTTNQALAVPPAGPWTYYARSLSTAPDGDVVNPQGVHVVSNRPAVLTSTPSDPKDLLQVHEFAVPAAGDFVVQHGYAMGTQRSVLDTTAATFTDLFARPAITFTAPVSGSEVTTVPVTVTGTVSDNVAVTSFTVNGVAVTPVAGTFSTTLTLTTSPSTITAVATDAAGNSTTATTTVTFKAVTFSGTSGPDTLTGNSLANTLNGESGDDTIDCGVGGRDTANGGAGNDVLGCVEPYAMAKANADTVNCGAGTRDVAFVDPFDTVVGCEKVTRVWKGRGLRDVFRQTKLANDRFDSLGGDNLIVCGGGIDTVLAGAGNDSVNCADTGSTAARRRSKDIVNCGAGPRDAAIIDRFDRTIGCERIIRR